MSSLLRDLRQAARLLRNRPGFSLAAITVLSLGIGANTAIFSLVNAFLLKPLAIREPGRLVGVFSRDTRRPDYRGFSYPNYADLRQNNAVFTSLLAHNLAMVGLAEGNATRRLFADIVSANYFETFGVALNRGRAFTPDEERPGSGLASAIVSFSYWKKTGADPQVLGRMLRINGHAFTIVGVAPEGFTGTTALISPEVYLPLGMYEQVINDFEGHGRPLSARDHHALILAGRLRPGLTATTAGPLLTQAAARLEQAYPGENRYQTFTVHPLSRMSISTSPQGDTELKIPSVLLLAMAGVVLLIASLNVANMMLARGAARGKEIAIRLAVGGSRGDILRQFFVEGLLLATLGAAAGLAAAWWSTAAIVRSMAMLAPVDLVYSAAPDVRVLAATMAFCIASTVLFGLAPGLRLSRPNLVPALKEGALDPFSGKPRRLLARRNVLVMSQVALSLMLLTAAGMFVRSSFSLARMKPGFRLENALRIEVDPSLAGYDEARGRQLYRTLLARLRTLPGVESASMAATVPFGMVSLGRSIQLAPDRPKLGCRSNIVGADYFQVMGIPLVRGRAFSPAEAEDPKTPKVAILDQLAVERLGGGHDLIGRRLRLLPQDGAPAADVEVVGIVGNIRDNAFGEELSPHVYVPFGQQYQAGMHLHVAAAGGREAQAALIEALRGTLRAVDPGLPVLSIKTMRAHVETSFDWWLVATGARLFLLFGGVALLLAVAGLYGVRSYTVALRTREIGIRMALGADSGDALRMILREGVLLTAIGIAAGLVLSLGISKILASMLYRATAFDPAVLTLAPLLLAAVSLLACFVPARRAARVEPIVALRQG